MDGGGIGGGEGGPPGGGTEEVTQAAVGVVEAGRSPRAAQEVEAAMARPEAAVVERVEVEGVARQVAAVRAAAAKVRRLPRC